MCANYLEALKVILASKCGLIWQINVLHKSVSQLQSIVVTFINFFLIISRSFGRYLSRTISCLQFILNRFLLDAHRFILKGQFNIFLSYVYSAPSKDKSTWVMKIKFRNHKFEQIFPSLNIILLIFSIVF